MKKLSHDNPYAPPESAPAAHSVLTTQQQNARLLETFRREAHALGVLLMIAGATGIWILVMAGIMVADPGYITGALLLPLGTAVTGVFVALKNLVAIRMARAIGIVLLLSHLVWLGGVTRPGFEVFTWFFFATITLIALSQAHRLVRHALRLQAAGIALDADPRAIRSGEFTDPLWTDIAIPTSFDTVKDQANEGKSFDA